MAQLLFFFLCVAGAIALVWLLIRYNRRVMQRLAAAWQQTATLVGGKFEPAAGSWLKPSSMTIAAEIEGVVVHVDHYTVQHGKSSTTYTRITASSSAPPDLELKVYVEGFLSTIGKALGTQDVVIGDKEFDDTFMVKANDEDLARLWLSSQVRRAALATREYHLSLAAGAVSSIRVGIEADAERLACAMRAAAICANRGQELLEAWRGLARALGGDLSTRSLLWPGDPDAAIKLEHHGALITIALDPGAIPGDPRRLGTRVRAARAASAAERFTIRRRAHQRAAPADPFGDPAFAAAYTLEATDHDRALRRFTDELRRNVLALAPEEITAEEADVALVLDGAVLQRKRLDAAIAIAAALVAPISDGPYR